MIKKYILTLLVLFLFPISAVLAITASSGENVFVGGVPVEGNAFLTGNSVTIDNEVKGDAFAFGEKIYVNGKIDGDLICAAKEVIVNGEVNGNIRCAFQTLKVNGKIERSVLGLGEDMAIEKNGSVGRDLMFAGESADVDGVVNGSLDVASSVLNINGNVKQNINFYSEEKDSKTTGLFVNSGSSINGNVNYNAFGEIKGTSTNSILGTTNKYTPKVEDKDIKSDILSQVGFIVALILTTLAIVVIGGKSVESIAKKMTGSIWKAVGIGAISFFALPIIGIALMISGFGAFLGIVCFLIWLTILLLALFFAGISLGELLIRKIGKKEKSKFILNSLIGVLIGYVLIIIPILGFILFFFGLWWGMGGVILSFAENRKEELE